MAMGLAAGYELQGYGLWPCATVVAVASSHGLWTNKDLSDACISSGVGMGTDMGMVTAAALVATIDTCTQDVYACRHDFVRVCFIGTGLHPDDGPEMLPKVWRQLREDL